MKVINKKEPILLFLGDVLVFLVSLYLMLIVRYHEFPSSELFYEHLVPFSILFATWVLVFYVAGLYEKHTLILKSKLPSIILNAQIVNTVLSVLFFYFIPYFNITPKTNLFLYLFFSFILMLGWRLYGVEKLGIRRRHKALLIGSGREMKELFEEVNNNNRYHLQFVSSVDLDEIDGLDIKEEIINRVYSEEINSIVVDLRNEKVETLLPHLYNLIFSKVRFLDMHRVYEDIFDRIPPSLVRYSWFLENISLAPHGVYDFIKRMMDIVIAGVLAVVSLVVYPFVWLAIMIDDQGAIFSIQERVGKNNKLIKLYKFRTMTNANDGGVWGNGNTNRVTKVGVFLRNSRIDELPQLWNVLRGHISLIGPRPEFAEPVAHYTEEIAYYNVRHLIKPGLSGWAQIYGDHAHHGTDISVTANKLSYDLYYIKNRSVMLDVKIALRTLKILTLRSGE
ncbi:hypothetical protein COB55_02350 [Candidatus Wolfebacteria bacterium]|nr:MAG: hypothetical protein COB55_02350 [Candidatus Wolfebacteria bacterium]